MLISKVQSKRIGSIRNALHLTAREHFICHKLLVFGLKNTRYYYASLKAINKFRQIQQNQKRVIHSRDYAFLKKCSSIAMTGINNPMFNRTGINHPNFGKTMTAEQRENIGRSSKGRKWTDEAKNLRRKITKERWNKPEFKKQMSDAHKGKSQSEEHKKARSQAMKNWWTAYKLSQTTSGS